ncbi:alpha-ketoglutarate-dependent dioxygenase AlkB family protein [Aestuariirhabdus sp. LZHN29]|uniref:alpha-ketoglutarate-dependent dioxygenase AlkB family protein n=1 Tax=Aestuariirhabdus sp. LZHN29 TaxID=3417462 RepID=UPI003CEB493F
MMVKEQESVISPEELPCNARATTIPLVDGTLQWYPTFLSAEVADTLLRTFESKVTWRQDFLQMGARHITIPRLQAWYGDQGYRYSGLWLEPAPFLGEHHVLLKILRESLGLRINSVLMNLYRDGNDSVGWHADDESVLGENPCIASLSLGGTRRFHLRHRQDSRQRLSLELSHGSLLVMSGPIQHCWRHQIPKTRRPVAPRINLTFRYLHPDRV